MTSDPLSEKSRPPASAISPCFYDDLKLISSRDVHRRTLLRPLAGESRPLDEFFPRGGGGGGASIGADEQQKQHVLSSGDPLGSLLNPTATSFGFTMISAGGGVIASPTSQFNTDN